MDVSEHGSIKFNFPHLEPWEMVSGCVLDIADSGGMTLEDTGRAINLTRERVRQYELVALVKLRQEVTELGVGFGDMILDERE